MQFVSLILSINLINFYPWTSRLIAIITSLAFIAKLALIDPCCDRGTLPFKFKNLLAKLNFESWLQKYSFCQLAHRHITQMHNQHQTETRASIITFHESMFRYLDVIRLFNYYFVHTMLVYCQIIHLQKIMTEQEICLQLGGSVLSIIFWFRFSAIFVFSWFVK